MVHLWKNGHPRKLLTLTKTILWSHTRQTVFLQNFFNHIRLSFCGISDTSNNFFRKNFTFACLFNFYWTSKQKVRYAQVLAFLKVAKIEGEVFFALRASQGDLEPSRATISPQSPCSLIPGIWTVFKGFWRQSLFTSTFQDCPSFSNTFQACANPVKDSCAMTVECILVCAMTVECI